MSNGPKATAFTSKTILAHYLNPYGEAALTRSAELTPFTNTGSGGVFLG